MSAYTNVIGDLMTYCVVDGGLILWGKISSNAPLNCTGQEVEVKMRAFVLQSSLQIDYNLC